MIVIPDAASRDPECNFGLQVEKLDSGFRFPIKLENGPGMTMMYG